MAGTPDESPTKFVCKDCNSIYAGVPAETNPPYKSYRAPDVCQACESERFITFGEFDRLYK